MGKRYIQNDTDNTMFVGSVMIPAGQGREVDEQFLPPADGDAGQAPSGEPAAGGPTDEQLQANLRELLAQPLRELLPQLEGLGAETLKQLQAMEQAGETPRSTLLGAISKLLLDRAQQAAGGELA